MPVYQDKKTKKWFYRTYYKDLYGNNKQRNSKLYDLKKEAISAEQQFHLKISNEQISEDITFYNLWISFCEFEKAKVKITSYESIKSKEKHYEPLFHIKMKDFELKHFNQWKDIINQENYSTTHKNNIYKYLRGILNYGNKYMNLNKQNLLNKMTNFTNPNELKKEMLFFTYDEFKQFISVEDNLNFKAFFEMLYFCGLRQGEAQALTWNDINLQTGYITINKTVSTKIKGKRYVILPPKTKSSNRVIVTKNKELLSDLQQLYLEKQKIVSFNTSMFIFGDVYPLATTTIQNRKNNNCKKADVKQIRIHDFRHSCASLLINQGASITLISKYLGHSDKATTLNTYSHMFHNELETIAQSLENL